MRDSWDVAVLGAGPAGGEAARAAAMAGASVLLIDEQSRPGGQVWRAKDTRRGGLRDTAEAREGDRHRKALAGSDVTFLGAARLWHIEERSGGWRLHVLVGGHSQTHLATCVILAPGAREYVQPFPGWTTPGVYGLAGVTALMKSRQCPPGHRVVVAGGGPLALFAAAEILRLGAQVAAVATPNSLRDWARRIPAIAANPALALRGAGMAYRLKRAGVPIFWRHIVTEAGGAETLTGVKISRCDAEWTAVGPSRDIAADTLCVGHGLVPNTEVSALAGLELVHDASLGVWTAPTGPGGETALPGLYLCGDGAVLRGAETARRRGRQVGAFAARKLLRQGSGRSAMKRPDRAERFGKAMTGLAVPGLGLVELTRGETIVCRCENLTRTVLDAAINAGAISLGSLKSATRCGMGPCGGKYCMTAAARLIARRTGAPLAEIAPPTPRPPLFPLPVSAIAAGIAYDDLPIPPPAPL